MAENGEREVLPKQGSSLSRPENVVRHAGGTKRPIRQKACGGRARVLFFYSFNILPFVGVGLGGPRDTETNVTAKRKLWKPRRGAVASNRSRQMIRDASCGTAAARLVHGSGAGGEWAW